MPRYSANLSMLFTELPFLNRFGAARAAGFEAVECWFPTPEELLGMRHALDDEGLSLIVINSAPGNTKAGDWGLAAAPGREAEFERSVRDALHYADVLCCPFVHVMGGIAPASAAREAFASYQRNIDRAARWAERSGVILLLEPLNHRDRPGYVMVRTDEAASIIARHGQDRLGLMFDVYHVQISEGDITHRLRRLFPIIRHVQVASVPDRSEPDQGEIAYGEIVAELDRLGYAGHVGCEYRPRTTTQGGLTWMNSRGLAATL